MDLWMEILLIIGSLLFLIYLWAKRRYKYFEERGIPYLEPYFPFGNTFWTIIGKEQMGDSFERVYDKLRGARIAGAFQLFTPTYVVMDPELAHRIFVTDFTSFHSHGFVIDEETNPLEGHLFNLDGEKWRVMRKKLSPTFTSGKLKWMFHSMKSCGDAMMTTLDEEIVSNPDIEVRDLLARFTTDVIGSCAFGLEPESIKDKNSKFRVMGKKIFTGSLVDFILFSLRMAFPKLFNSFKIRTVPKEMNDFFFSIVTQTFQHRLKTGEKRNDFIQLLLELREKGYVEFDSTDAPDEYEVGSLEDSSKEPAKFELTDDVLTAQAFIFFAAGFETSASTLSFVLYQLSKQPEAQEKVRKEIRASKERHGGQINYDMLKELPYLDACIMESQRIMPPFQIFFRQCTKDIMLDGVLIPKGAPIMIPTRRIQNDPAHFPDPDQFIPERFIGQHPKPGSFVPFGDGPRICIARRFALVEIKMAVAMILDRYDVAKSATMKEPIKLDPRAFVATPIGGLWVRFSKRDDYVSTTKAS